MIAEFETTAPADAVTVCKDFVVEAPAETVWAALRDVGALHTHLARGFVTHTEMDGQDRIVTFANGMVARERIVEIDEAARRVRYRVVEAEILRFHRASAQVFPLEDGRSRFVWTAELAPPEAGAMVSDMMDDGVAAMQRTLGDGR
jgi:hypothetical protein